MERSFNIRAGFTAGDDRLPDRFYTEKITIEGRSLVCRRDAFDQMHREYYDAMGWDGDGRPTGKTLRALGLEELLPKDRTDSENTVAVSGT